LKATYAIEEGSYLIQTPTSGFVLGPYAGVATSKGLSTPKEMYCNEDDSTTLSSWRKWLENYCRHSPAGATRSSVKA
jgi:hypothetical protein